MRLLALFAWWIASAVELAAWIVAAAMSVPAIVLLTVAKLVTDLSRRLEEAAGQAHEERD